MPEREEGWVEEALRVATTAGYPAGWPHVEKSHPQPITASANDRRPSTRLSLVGGKSILVAVSKKDGGVGFGHWYTALSEAMPAKSVVGAVVVWPRAQLTAKSGASLSAYKKNVSEGRIRPFALDDNEATFHQIETLRQLVQVAKTEKLPLGAESVDETRCRELAVQTGVIANLKLFDFVFKDWPGLTAPAPPPGPVAQPVVPPPS